jgi:hypothetical protein
VAKTRGSFTKGHPKIPGSGIKKGQPQKATLNSLHDEALLQEMVRQAMRPMVEAQVAAATGYRHLVARDKRGGKFKPITPDQIEALNEGELVEEIWEKHPSPEAFRVLLDRAYGRPVEKLQASLTHEAGPKLEVLLRNLARVGNGNGSA